MTIEIPPSHVVYHIPSSGNGTYTKVTLADRLLRHEMGGSLPIRVLGLVSFIFPALLTLAPRNDVAGC